jgi:PleD family two-component response regulator
MRELHQLSAAHISTNEAIVSGGMSEYDPKQDKNIQSTFERADSQMYKEKKLLKSLGAVTREDEPDQSDYGLNDTPFINVRKHILIADDIPNNRELLGDLLQEDYDIFYAADGVEALEILREHKDEIALLLLDLYMPNLTGREVMMEMQVDEDLMSIPVIVLTVDQDAELDCLKIGAMDFITKPYPDIDIVKARIAKCIELSENRDLIRHTERDKLTGLFNFDYFIRYVERIDIQSKGAVFDALVCDVNRFHSVNEQYGRQFGDLVLRSIGISFRKLARKTGGIACRRGETPFCCTVRIEMTMSNC